MENEHLIPEVFEFISFNTQLLFVHIYFPINSWLREIGKKTVNR